MSEEKKPYDRHKWTKENTKTFSVTLRNDKYDLFCQICDEEGVKRGTLINEWIDAYIKEHTC